MRTERFGVFNKSMQGEESIDPGRRKFMRLAVGGIAGSAAMWTLQPSIGRSIDYLASQYDAVVGLSQVATGGSVRSDSRGSIEGVPMTYEHIYSEEELKDAIQAAIAGNNSVLADQDLFPSGVYHGLIEAGRSHGDAQRLLDGVHYVEDRSDGSCSGGACVRYGEPDILKIYGDTIENIDGIADAEERFVNYFHYAFHEAAHLALADIREHPAYEMTLIRVPYYFSNSNTVKKVDVLEEFFADRHSATLIQSMVLGRQEIDLLKRLPLYNFHQNGIQKLEEFESGQHSGLYPFDNIRWNNALKPATLGNYLKHNRKTEYLQDFGRIVADAGLSHGAYDKITNLHDLTYTGAVAFRDFNDDRISGNKWFIGLMAGDYDTDYLSYMYSDIFSRSYVPSDKMHMVKS